MFHAPTTFEQENFIRYNLRRILVRKLEQKNKNIRLRQKNDILIKKRKDLNFCLAVNTISKMYVILVTVAALSEYREGRKWWREGRSDLHCNS